MEAKNAATGGLRDGDECEDEVADYRDCRAKLKEAKKKQQQG